MLIVSISIMLFMTVCICLNFKNKFMYVISLQMIASAVAVFVALIYTAKVPGAYYSFENPLDYWIYIKLYGIRIPLPYISRIYSSVFVCLMVNAIIFVCVMRKPNPFLVALGFIPVIFFWVWTDPRTIYVTYLNALESSFWQHLSNICSSLAENVFILYLLAPEGVLVYELTKTKMFMRRRALSVVGISMLFSSIYICTTFVFGVFRNIWFRNVDVSMVIVEPAQKGAIPVVSVTLLVVMALILIFLIWFRPFGIFSNLFRLRNRIWMRRLNSNLSMHLHVYKNAFMTIGQQFVMLKHNQEHGCAEEMKKNIDLGMEISQETLQKIVHTLQLLREPGAILEPVCPAECIDLALHKLEFGRCVQVFNQLADGNGKILGEQFALVEAFSNILINAVEATKRAERDPEITITLSEESGYCVLDFTDNGIGMNKQERRVIFEPFYSTKPNLQCGGIGLSYVKRVVEDFNGYVDVFSESGIGTTFQLSFPIYKARRNR